MRPCDSVVAPPRQSPVEPVRLPGPTRVEPVCKAGSARGAGREPTGEPRRAKLRRRGRGQGVARRRGLAERRALAGRLRRAGAGGARHTPPGVARGAGGAGGERGAGAAAAVRPRRGTAARRTGQPAAGARLRPCHWPAGEDRPAGRGGAGPLRRPGAPGRPCTALAGGRGAARAGDPPAAAGRDAHRRAAATSAGRGDPGQRTVTARGPHRLAAGATARARRRAPKRFARQRGVAGTRRPAPQRTWGGTGGLRHPAGGAAGAGHSAASRSPRWLAWPPSTATAGGCAVAARPGEAGHRCAPPSTWPRWSRRGATQ